MKTRILVLGAFVVVMHATGAGAQQAAPTSPAASAAQPIQIAQTFLVAWGHERWDELKTVAGDQVTVRVGDKTYTLQPGANAEVKLMFPFRGLSTVRADGGIKGITIQDLGLKVGDNEVRGTGTLTLQEKDGEFRVVGVSTGK